MGSIKAGGKSGAIFGDDDYLSLEKLSVAVKGTKEEKVSFTLCFWIYVLKSSKPGILIRQSREGSELSVPFLTFDADRKVNLCPLPPPACAHLPEAGITNIVTSDKPFPLEKWVHFGCEVASDVARLHMDGVVVGEKALTSPLQDESEVLPLHLYGGDGPAYANSVQAYAHYVRLLPQPTVTNHYVKNPPLELMLDGSSGASEDNEVEEGGDGVWSVVGGKASCRRNFALDVALLDALGRSIHKDMELVALLVYSDSGSPVEKPKDDSEAPLLTTFDGVEFPSTERPIKLVHGRASFKLKISQLSSKCDNRLFRVCFDSLNTPKYPFLRAFSRPIRCVSRNRNHRHPTVTWKRQSPAIAPAESGLSPSTEEPQLPDFSKLKNNFHSNGTAAGPTMNGGSVLPPVKRLCTAADKVAPPTANGLSAMERPCEPVGGGFPSPVTIEMQVPVIRGGHSMAAQLNAGYNWLGGISPDTRPKEAMDSFGHSLKQDGIITEGVHGLNGAGLEIPRMQKTFGLALGASDGAFSDYLVFHYCLLSMCGRVQFLRKNLMSKSEHQINDFASRVSEYTGCRHNGYQIRIARQLLHEGGEIWKKASRDFHPVLWVNLITHVEESFLKISGCNTRRFTEKDREFVRRIAGCGEFVSPDEFDRLWHWIFPVAFALSSPQLRALWEMQDPRWIEGMISREEGESLLKTSHGIPKPGVFLLRFANSRIWPHPDAGALVVSYVGADMRLNHKLLSLDENLGSALGDRLDSATPLSDLLLSQPELSELCRVPNAHSVS